MEKYLILIFISCSTYSLAQNPLVMMWDYRFGGTNNDALASFELTGDGGYLLSGRSSSGIGGDKTEALKGLTDYWIVKLDSLGNKMWDKDFGGTDYDFLYDAKQTKDGGYIVAGYSESGIGGDKTEPLQGGVLDQDYWILKIDSTGSMEWDKDFGGTNDEWLTCVEVSNDGGYLIGGQSSSGIGGHKTQPLWGTVSMDNDFWIIKTDSLGNKLWDKDFGGTNYDVVSKIKQTGDGGYILGGHSRSGMNGNKSEPNWDPSESSYDFWIVKIDSIGNKIWDRTYGGDEDEWLFALQQCPDGGFILAGITHSEISGNKTTPLWGNWLNDYWIVKTDSLGNKMWERDFGTTDYENVLNSIVCTNDGGYLIGGSSQGDISGDKTENNLGSEQSWFIKIDSLGNKQWDKTIFLVNNNSTGRGIQTTDGCYAFANYNTSPVGGYRTQPSQGGSDYWMVKFCETTSALAYFTTDDVNTCPGTCIDYLNLSFNGTAYQWTFPGAIPDTSTAVNPANICYANPGTYDVQLITSNANGNDTLLLTNYITVYPTPPPQGIYQNGDTLFAISGSATYQWYFNSQIIPGATDYFYVASVNGDFNVVATDLNGCEVEAAIFNVMVPVQVLMDTDQLNIFPIPVQEILSVNSPMLSGKVGTISIFNLLGERIMDTQITLNASGTTLLNVSQLSSGIYYLEFTSSEKSYRIKFIKQ